MSKAVKEIEIPMWITWFYGMFSLSLAIWIVFLYFSLPVMHESTHWRAMWVIFDIFLLSQGLLTFYFLCKKSPWVVLSLSALIALFVSDIWFDIMTSITDSERTMAILAAVLAEMPLIILSLMCAVYVFRQVIGLDFKKVV